jgi:hypothetical protein
MALHGTLNVNGRRIGSYEIRRLAELTDPGAEYEYAWSVTLAAWSEARRGTTRHRYSDGAAILLAKVLTDAGEAE